MPVCARPQARIKRESKKVPMRLRARELVRSAREPATRRQEPLARLQRER